MLQPIFALRRQSSRLFLPSNTCCAFSWRPSGTVHIQLLRLIDLLAVIPFYFSTGIDLLVLRAFRLLKLVRYTSAVIVFRKAMRFAKGQLITFGFLTLVFLFISSAVMYASEHRAQPGEFRSLFDSLWWVIESLLRIDLGYRGIYPVTLAGRVSPTS